MISQLKLQINYFQKAVIEIQKSLDIFYWARESNPTDFNQNYPFCLIPFDFLDQHKNPKDEYYDLELVVLLPIFYGENKCRKKNFIELKKLIEYSEGSINWLSKKIGTLKSYNDPQKNEFFEMINLPSKTQSINPLRKPLRGELKKNCEEIAIALGFEKDRELTKDDVKLVCEALEKIGIEPNRKSVASTLRDKLGYRKYI